MPAAASTDYVDSYYARSLADNLKRPALEGDVEAEVCVVGGGMAGLATALGLAERGSKVVLLESRRVGCRGFRSRGVAAPAPAW